MSNETHTTEQQTQSNLVSGPRTRQGMDRRSFLRATATSATVLAALPVVGAEPVGAAPLFDPNQQGGNGSGRGNGGGGGRGQRLPKKNETDPLVVDDLRTIAETWAEPWVWRPSKWPGQPLVMNVVENAAPIAVTGANFANGKPLLFSYNGTTPGPTIRMKGNETLYIHLRNMLGLNPGKTAIGPCPDPKGPAYPGPEGVMINQRDGAGVNVYGTDEFEIPATLRDDWCLGEHTNGIHSTHVTNLHTHGLHVRPEENPDGTHSDNVILRILPEADWAARQEDLSGDCRALREDEVVAQARYEFRLGHVQGDPEQAHPAGTFWYHPHTHGSTHNQVASGMAGFLLIEGEFDQYVNEQLAGESEPDPTRRTGPYDYRERLMLVQRVNVTADDPDMPPRNVAPRTQSVIFNATNGSYEPRIITMRPGAIERWRVLNGSVDGKSYLSFAVLKGRYEYNEGALQAVDADGNKTNVPDRATLDAAKQHLWLLAWDGVGLMRETEPGEAEYFVKDLNFPAPANPLKLDFSNIADCYQNAETIRACYNRPNELDMAAANRADIFFQAPLLEGDATAQIYTIIGLGTALHTDGAPRDDTIVAYVIVSGDPVDAVGDADANSYNQSGYDFSTLELPPVEPYLLPIQPKELMVLDPDDVSEQLPAQQQYVLRNEIEQYNSVERERPLEAGAYRTRKVTYAGWGAGDFPQIEVPQSYIEENPELARLRYYTPPASLEMPFGTWTDFRQPNGEPLPPLLLPPLTRTMSVDGKKFDPMRQEHPQMLWWTAEEWSVTNNSATLWYDSVAEPLKFVAEGMPETADEVKAILEELNAALAENPFDPELTEWINFYTGIFQKPGGDPDNPEYWSKEDPPPYWSGHRLAYPLTLAEVNERNAADPQNPRYQITTKGADHPFHIHQNPFWLIRIDVPDENGNLVNILQEPRWSDVVWLPRNGGRVVFRARFPDYLGVYVDHCHILLHEDNGMMQAVETVPTANSANYVPSTEVATFEGDGNEWDGVYATDSQNLAAAWQSSLRFVDNTHDGQIFPGFDTEPPVSS